MVRLKVPGSVYERANGRWTAQTPQIYDPTRQQWRRLSLGTFATRAEAEEKLRDLVNPVNQDRL
jgi:hypothetical protein